MMGGAALEALPRACALCAAPLGPDDGRRVCGGCRGNVERVLGRFDPSFVAELRRRYGLEER